jgi:hypothetical protein
MRHFPLDLILLIMIRVILVAINYQEKLHFKWSIFIFPGFYFFQTFINVYSKSWFNTPPLGAENWGCGGFVPPQAQRFQGEIFNTPACSGDSLFLKCLVVGGTG